VTPQQIAELERFLKPEELAELNQLLAADFEDQPWTPLPGPQTMAYESVADVVGFGGAAGGGKSALGVGKALTKHQVVQVFRREGTELGAIIDEMELTVGHREGLGGKPPVWRKPSKRCRLVEFCSAPNVGDERKFQGRAKDLLLVDEAANFLESQVRFLMGWVRTTDPNQRTQTLLTFNPPTSAEGRWIIPFFGPWLDKKFQGKKAAPGELRYVAVINGKDRWVDTAAPFVLDAKGEPNYDFDLKDYTGARLALVVRPQSRTFIPSRITDNPYLVGTNYMNTLQAMPEPLRSQMLYGDFEAGLEDDIWQVIPTAWVEAAMARWKPRSPKGEMLAIGLDIARGGQDDTVAVSRHRTPEHALWFDHPKRITGRDTDNGDKAATHALVLRRDDAPINVDVIGVGASAFDSLKRANAQVWGVNVSERARRTTDRSGGLTFFNLRTDLWWALREALDPTADTGIELPPDPSLLAELCAPRWSLSGKTIKVESREEIVKRIGRSPDAGTAVVLALPDVPKVKALHDARAVDDVLNYDPMARM
jgi:hypothetical protein